jgi:hypothetical protein
MVKFPLKGSRGKAAITESVKQYQHVPKCDLSICVQPQPTALQRCKDTN